MKPDPLDLVMATAIEQGLLPAGATRPEQDSRPWPVVLLTALGAWLAALPLLGAVGLLLGDLISRSAGPYVVGPLVLIGSVVVLRSAGLPLFFEQLAIPALLVGGGTLAFGLFRDLQSATALALLGLLAVGLAVAIPRPWLRVVLGAAAASQLALALSADHWNYTSPRIAMALWCAWHSSLAAWLLAVWAQRSVLDDGARAHAAAALESIAAGCLLATLAGLAAWSGMGFLVGGAIGGGLAGEIARETTLRPSGVPLLAWLRAASSLLTGAAVLWLVRRWPSVRRAWAAGVALVLIGLAWFMTALGATVLALAVCVSTTRPRLATAAGIAAAWIIGSFYYQLTWPLATKALVLVAAGMLLAGLALWARPAQPPLETKSVAPRRSAWAGRLGITLTTVATLLVANFGIWQKEDLISHGEPVFVQLVPADPRSLMQGDFMRLNFGLPADVQAQDHGLLTAERPHVVARRDARGVATVLRVDQAGSTLAADELRLELTPKDGRWMLVSDAWFFKEGEADRWARAKFGEFRVEPGGRALLVDLRGPNLERL